MGNIIDRIRLKGRTETRILMVGLDAAGKTTILYTLKLGEVVTTIPTIGFNIETVEHKQYAFTVWDVGGKDKIRPLWRHYYQNTQAMIFVLDSNDAERLDEVHDELHRMLAEPELKDASLLVFANKQDLPNALSTRALTERLGLHTLRGRNWYIQGCCATNGEGLYEGLDWLMEAVTAKSNHPKCDVAARCGCGCWPCQRSSTCRAPSIPHTAKQATHEDVECRNPMGDKLAVVEAVPVHGPSPPILIMGTVEQRLASEDELCRQEVEGRSFVSLQLEPAVAETVQTALRLMSSNLSRARASTPERDVVKGWTNADDTLQVSEAHWARDRSQLRLLRRSSLSVHERKVSQPKQLPVEGPGDEEEVLAVLQQTWAALAAIAARIIGNGQSGESLAAASALDAFYYVSSGNSKEFSCAAHTDSCALTLIVADKPGLECRDIRTGAWSEVPLGMGQVAVLAGRSSRSLDLNCDAACEHRVRTSASTRNSLAIDFYASAQDLSA